MRKQTICTSLFATLIVLSFCAVAHATFQTLAQRLPAATNAIVAVNVTRLVDSPYGKNAGWGQRLADSWEKQPLMIPPGAQKLLMAAQVKPSSMDSIWEMSLIEMDELPSLETLAKDEGGHIDRVWDKDAVCSPINAYFIPLDKKVLASITPAERSEIARWVRQPLKPEGNVTSPYINEILKRVTDANTDIVMAMDLEGAYGVPNIRKWLDENDVEGVTPTNIDQVVRVLGTMKGISLEISVSDKINGKAIVPFDRDASSSDPAQASKKYYKTVCAILDNATAGKSAAESATWIRSASKRIDQLPILNVDPALVEWGGLVSARMKQAGAVLGVGQTQINARVAGVADPTYSYSYDVDGNYVSDSANRTARENANKQRRQAALEQKAQAQEQAMQIVNELAETRPKIRAEMVAKYNIEF